MNVKKIEIRDNKGKNKRLIAYFTLDDGKIKKVRFGLKNSLGTFADGAPVEKRENYIKRHSKMRENWTKKGLMTAGFLSRWVLWEKRSNEDILKLLNKLTGVSDIYIKFKRYKMDV